MQGLFVITGVWQKGLLSFICLLLVERERELKQSVFDDLNFWVKDF